MLLYEGRLLILTERARTAALLPRPDGDDRGRRHRPRRARRRAADDPRRLLPERPPGRIDGAPGAQLGLPTIRSPTAARAAGERRSDRPDRTRRPRPAPISGCRRRSSREDGRRSSGELLGCDQVRAPGDYSGRGMISVSTIDLSEGIDVVETDAVMSDGSTVYASTDSLYVATARWEGGSVDRDPSLRHLLGGRDHHVGSGSVEGSLLNQYSMSEYDGHLRVATTVEGGAGDVVPPTPTARASSRCWRSMRTAHRDRAARRPRADRGHQGCPLRRQARLHRHLPPDRSAVRGRSLQPRGPGAPRRAEDSRLLCLPAPGRWGAAAGRRPESQPRDRDHPGQPGLAVRSQRSRPTGAPRRAQRRGRDEFAGRGRCQGVHLLARAAPRGGSGQRPRRAAAVAARRRRFPSPATSSRYLCRRPRPQRGDRLLGR